MASVSLRVWSLGALGFDDDPCGFVGQQNGLPHVMQAKTLLMMDDNFLKVTSICQFYYGDWLMLFQDCGTISEFWTVIKVWTRQISTYIFIHL